MTYAFNLILSLIGLLISVQILNAKDVNLYSKAKVQLLNKLTGKYDQIILNADNVTKFDENLFIVLKACYKPIQKDDIENTAFIEVMKIYDKQKPIVHSLSTLPMPAYFNSITTQEGYEKALLFSGWMFSSSPSLSHMKDNIYDIVLIQCEGNTKTLDKSQNNN